MDYKFRPMNKLQNFIYMGTKQAGTLDPEDALMFVEESMTVSEYKKAEAFLKWAIANNRTFGYNLPDVWDEYTASKKGK